MSSPAVPPLPELSPAELSPAERSPAEPSPAEPSPAAPAPAATASPAPAEVSHPALATRPSPSPPGRRVTRRRLIIAAIVAVILVGVGIAAATTGGDDSSDDAADTATSAPATTAATGAAPATVEDGTTTTGAEETTTTPETTASTAPVPPYPEGILQVGVDIPAGRYEADGGAQCYWERLRGSDASQVVVNRLGGGHVVVDVSPDDTAFRSEKCGMWVPAGPFLAPQTEFDDGIWLVGTQVAPGRYRNSGGGSCYWARLKSFGGEAADIVTNGESTQPVTLDVQPTDVGIETRGCGRWTPA
jgi:hypothetical protein